MKTHHRITDLFIQLLHDEQLKSHLTFGQIIKKLGDRSYGFILLFFSIPSALPFSFIPGISFIFSIPIALGSLQMIIGRKTIWIPAVLANKSISKETFSKVIRHALPVIKKTESFLKPRYSIMNSRLFMILNGITIVFLSILLMLPIPLSNFFLASLIAIFSLGIIEKDGLFIIAGYVLSFFYISIMYVIILTVVQSILKYFS